ncbi:MAG: glutamyl-tRNA reductase [Nitrososphaeria archaeon]|nr:glutamyl-tRNA reductase [Nitrososphaeria archaeon]NDB45749.1 glutamyl-tRNA reductase [Nitrososphaeria archaeon]NDF26176.1 glutamyl-tRNA reductase [Nitrosopumilaceae archaeon]NDF46661.1 glutamyl-tRNA reductase [Nitrosopumilaceae archaeon]
MAENSFNVINVRVTFRNIPLHSLTRFSFKDLKAASEAFKKIPGVSECVILQTQSRVEIFTVNQLEIDSPDLRSAEGKGLIINKIKETWQSLTELTQDDIDHFDQILEVYTNNDVYSHLLRLACGLESVIVGHETILEEIKTTIIGAKTANTSGPLLNKLFDTVIMTATRIRNTTQISKHGIAWGDIVVKIAEQNAGLDAKKPILLMGTGEIAAMVAKALNKKSYPFEVCSQTIERATGFSKLLGGKPRTYKDTLKDFGKFDIVFVAGTADYFALTYDNLKIAMESKTKGTMIIDISDPRIVHDSVSGFTGTKLMFRDQITEMEDRNLKAKEEAITATEKIIAKEIAVIAATMKLVGKGPQISDVYANVDEIRKKELEKALELLGETDEKKIQIITNLTTSIVDNILPKPIAAK